MSDRFARVAAGYERLDTAGTPIRRYSEAFSCLEYIQPLVGHSVLELACSDGFFSRLLMQAGAGRVCAIDQSPRMIQIAEAAERRNPLGIDYRVADALQLPELGRFDILFCPFTMSYATDIAQLHTMCQQFFDKLEPGGRLLSFNDHPDLPEDGESGYAKYGKTKRRLAGCEGTPRIHVTWHAKNSENKLEALTFECRNFDHKALTDALTGAGFVDIRTHAPLVSSEGMRAFEPGFWDLILCNPLNILFEARRA